MQFTHKSISLQERIIFALDVDSLSETRRWLDLLGESINFYKVGLQLFLAVGFPAIDLIINRGHKVMVDLKFFDIPETVGLAVRALCRHEEITFITVHGNEAILRAAIKERNKAKILAVTVLTSFDESDLRAMNLNGSIEDLVHMRAKKAVEIGCDGIVSSGNESARIRAELGSECLIVTPGIRVEANKFAATDDQKRITSAHQAIRNGADHLVIGRPIRNAADPLTLVKLLQQQIYDAVNNKS